MTLSRRQCRRLSIHRISFSLSHGGVSVNASVGRFYDTGGQYYGKSIPTHSDQGLTSAFKKLKRCSLIGKSVHCVNYDARHFSTCHGFPGVERDPSLSGRGALLVDLFCGFIRPADCFDGADAPKRITSNTLGQRSMRYSLSNKIMSSTRGTMPIS